MAQEFPDCHHRDPDSRPDQSMWDLWWTVWHWDRFFYEFFGFLLSVLFHRGPPYSYHVEDEKHDRWWQQFRDIV
jgi:hypothetical protein